MKVDEFGFIYCFLYFIRYFPSFKNFIFIVKSFEGLSSNCLFSLSSRNRKPLSEPETFIGNKSIFLNLFIRKGELDKPNERESVHFLELEKSHMHEISILSF